MECNQLADVEEMQCPPAARVQLGETKGVDRKLPSLRPAPPTRRDEILAATLRPALEGKITGVHRTMCALPCRRACVMRESSYNHTTTAQSTKEFADNKN
jgi:hypothetical protein